MLDELKRYLNITWQDQGIDSKLLDLLEQSEKAINSLMGVEIDFDDDAELRELLFNRVRYAYNNSLEYFEINFAQEILRLQILEGVKAVENQTAENGADQ